MKTLKPGTIQRDGRPYCEHCENVALHRCSRFGFLQRVVFSRFGYYPWECGLCRREYMIRQRYIGGAQPRTLSFPGEENLLPWRPPAMPSELRPARPSQEDEQRSVI